MAAQADQTAVDVFGGYRFILYQDMQTNGAQAQGEDLMTAPGAASVVMVNTTFQNSANFGRFRVLKDKTFYGEQRPPAVYDGTNIEIGGAQIPFKMTVKFRKPVVIRFNATNGGSVADIVDNSFHLIGHNGTTVAAAVSYTCRTVYTDN